MHDQQNIKIIKMVEVILYNRLLAAEAWGHRRAR